MIALPTLFSAGANNLPQAEPDSYTVGINSILFTAAAPGVLKNDSDADGDPLTARLVTGPSHGKLSFKSTALLPIPLMKISTKPTVSRTRRLPAATTQPL